MPQPTETKVISVWWIYKSRCKADGTLEKYKAILVVNGYAQHSRINFDETLLPRPTWLPSGRSLHWHSRLHICFTANLVSSFNTNPRQKHWQSANHTLSYLEGTIVCILRKRLLTSSTPNSPQQEWGSMLCCMWIEKIIGGVELSTA